ncbi:MAG: molybdopterin-binding protein [Tissierellia bacterium]|nr:molybdopterin-binding protein [Tissierellia bacterium]
MKRIKTIDAVGEELVHDLTRIVKDVHKGREFKRGHIVQEEDIQRLLSMGKTHLYVKDNENDEDLIFEEDAAVRLKDLCINEHMYAGEISEGKIEIFSDIDGLFTVDIERLNKINELKNIMIATRWGGVPVKKNAKLAGMRVIPLFIKKDELDALIPFETGEPLLKVHPLQDKKVGIVITGSEVYHGRIEDKFKDVLESKCNDYSLEIVDVQYSDDDMDMILKKISVVREKGANIILCTGGMSVDPDDLTPGAIKESGAEIITYGSPVLPGAMFLLGYFKDGTTIMGLPGSVMYEKQTVFDLIFPYTIADITLTKRDIAKLGYGGLLMNPSREN